MIFVAALKELDWSPLAEPRPEEMAFSSLSELI